MEMIMRTCSAMKAAYNESDCQKEGTTHSKNWIIRILWCVLINLTRTYIFVSFLLRVLEHPTLFFQGVI